MKFFFKYWSYIFLFLIVISGTKAYAQCATQCGETGTAPYASCGVVGASGLCGISGQTGTCQCQVVAGCAYLGNSCTLQGFTSFQNAPSSCCGGVPTPTSQPSCAAAGALCQSSCAVNQTQISGFSCPSGQICCAGGPPATSTPSGGSVACNGSCTTSAQCSGGRICSGGFCRNASCTGQTNCTCPGATNTPVPTSPPSVCTPNQWYPASPNCGQTGCGGCYSAQCNSSGTGWNCVNNPSSCCPAATPIPPTAIPSSLNVNLTANPTNGTSPLNGVDLSASVGGTQTGNITYRFDCTNNGTWELTTSSIATNPYTAVDLCGYSSPGIYTALVSVTRGALTATDTVTINVGAGPTNTPIPPTNTPVPPTNTPIVNPVPVVDLKVNGSDNPPAITSGSTVTVSWTVSNATTCTSQSSPSTTGWTNGTSKTATNGTHSQSGVGGISSNTTLSITCNGPGGSASNSVLVQVVPPASPPTVTLTVNNSTGPLTVTSGQTVSVGWTVTNSTSCTASTTSPSSPTTANWNGSVSATTGIHSQSNVGPITSARTLSITCTGPGGSDTSTVQLLLAASNAVSVDLQVNGGNGPVSVTSGNTVNVTWVVNNAIGNCTATATVATTGWSGSKSQSGGSQNGVGPITSARTLTLTCPGSGGTQSSDSVDLVLAAAPTPTTVPDPIVDLKINGQDTAVIAPNTTVTATWDTTNAASCQSSATVATTNWVNNSAKTPGLNQSQSNIGPISSGRTLTLTCQNINGISRSDNVPVILATPSPTAAAGQCLAPAPRDPPVTDCATSGSDTVTITWQWNTVAIANQYQFSVQNSSGATVYGPVTLSSASSCSGATCSTTTNLLPGSYRSRIIASSSASACTPSSASFSNYINVPLCSSVSAPTVTLLVDGSSGPVDIAPNDTVSVSWSTTDASTCTATTTSPANPTTTGWTGNKAVSGNQTGVGPINSDRSLTLTCQGPNGTAADTVEINIAAPPSCGAALHDPPTTTCSAPPSQGTISWEWNAVGGNATNYIVTIYNAATNAVVTTSGNQSASFFTGSGAPCSFAGTTCRYTTSHSAGTSYYSVIQSLSNPAGSTCVTATSSPSSPTSVSLCPGTYEARAKRISPSNINDCSASSTPLAASMSFSSANVTPGGTTNTGASYSTWSAAPGTYTLSSTAAAGYILQTACIARNAGPSSPSNLTQAISSNETVTYDLLYTFGTPWSRGQDGEMNICTDLASTIPTLANPNPEFVLPGPGGYPGIVSYGTSYDFDGSGGGSNYVSSTDWLAHESIPAMCTTDWYQYFANKFDIASLTPIANNPGLKTKNDFPSDVNIINGNISLSGVPGAWNLGANQTKIIFVNGNVQINGNITNAGKTFFALIVNGNITIAPTVGTLATTNTPSLQGLFVTSTAGRFITGQSSNAGTEKLVVKGTVIAGGFTLQRDLDAVNHNQDTPGEDFIYDPELLLTMPDEFKDLRIKWEEVAP